MRNKLANGVAKLGLHLLAQGAARSALTLLATAARLAPRDAQLRYSAARAAQALGSRDLATQYCEDALALDFSLAEPHQLLRELYLHGEWYLALLQRIHHLLRPRTYLEVGVDKGESIRMAGAEARCIGIDPAPSISGALPPNVRIFKQTSDRFFTETDVRRELGGLPVDLAFIDGLHQFDAALNDFINIEQLCHPDSTVLIHDCFPHDRTTAERERRTDFWSGDVWKLIVLLKKYRPGLSVNTVAAPPTGLCVVRNLEPASRVLSDRRLEITREFLDLDYAFLRNRRAEKLGLFPNNWDQVRRLLQPATTP